MAARHRAFFIRLPGDNRIRVRFTRWGRDVVAAMVQLEARIGGRWLPCRRYDSHLGLFHVHPSPWDEISDPRHPVPIEDLGEGLTFAIDDLKANWARYRRACEDATRRETQ